jgi:hypothetical protein
MGLSKCSRYIPGDQNCANQMGKGVCTLDTNGRGCRGRTGGAGAGAGTIKAVMLYIQMTGTADKQQQGATTPQLYQMQ